MCVQHVGVSVSELRPARLATALLNARCCLSTSDATPPAEPGVWPSICSVFISGLLPVRSPAVRGTPSASNSQPAAGALGSSQCGLARLTRLVAALPATFPANSAPGASQSGTERLAISPTTAPPPETIAAPGPPAPPATTAPVTLRASLLCRGVGRDTGCCGAWNGCVGRIDNARANRLLLRRRLGSVRRGQPAAPASWPGSRTHGRLRRRACRLLARSSGPITVPNGSVAILANEVAPSTAPAATLRATLRAVGVAACSPDAGRSQRRSSRRLWRPLHRMPLRFLEQVESGGRVSSCGRRTASRHASAPVRSHGPAPHTDRPPCRATAAGCRRGSCPLG